MESGNFRFTDNAGKQRGYKPLDINTHCFFTPDIDLFFLLFHRPNDLPGTLISTHPVGLSIVHDILLFTLGIECIH